MHRRQYYALNTYMKFSPWRAFNFTTFLGSLTLPTNRNRLFTIVFQFQKLSEVQRKFSGKFS